MLVIVYVMVDIFFVVVYEASFLLFMKHCLCSISVVVYEAFFCCCL